MKKEKVLDGYLDLIKMILPEILVEHFNLTESKKVGEKLNLYFEEKNVVPSEYNLRQLVSKGFHKSITVQDFPLKGRFVYFHIKRRRWTDKGSSTKVGANHINHLFLIPKKTNHG